MLTQLLPLSYLMSHCHHFISILAMHSWETLSFKSPEPTNNNLLRILQHSAFHSHKAPNLLVWLRMETTRATSSRSLSRGEAMSTTLGCESGKFPALCPLGLVEFQRQLCCLLWHRRVEARLDITIHARPPQQMRSDVGAYTRSCWRYAVCIQHTVMGFAPMPHSSRRRKEEGGRKGRCAPKASDNLLTFGRVNNLVFHYSFYNRIGMCGVRVYREVSMCKPRRLCA